MIARTERSQVADPHNQPKNTPKHAKRGTPKWHGLIPLDGKHSETP